MSKTSIKERNKAIKLAWEREQILVTEGKGTRDWSQNQQKDILDPDKGKAYDENGRAFEGQHMASRDYPDERSSPREHDVSGYNRQQNGKTVHVNPYKRGGSHNDD